MNTELLTRTLATGAHADRSNGLCAMELVAWLADLPHSDHPDCTCVVLGAFTRRLNDGLPDAERQLLKPLLPKLIGTVTDKAGLERRAFVAADWAVRVVVPLHLRRAKLDDEAKALEALQPIVDRETAAIGRDAAMKARRAAAAAAYAADYAAADYAAYAADYAAADAAYAAADAAAYAAAAAAYAAAAYADYAAAAAYAADYAADAAYADAAADAAYAAADAAARNEVCSAKTSEGITLAESAVACLGRMVEA